MTIDYLDIFQRTVLPLLFAVGLGGAIGLEREAHGRPAGLRTHILVCLSATMLITVSRHVEAGQLHLGEIGRLVFDPNRMGAGIVTGIGFLGAATVLRIGDLVRGITTAACIWYVAGLGIVIGQQEYVLATIGTVIVLAVLLGVTRIASGITPIVYRRLTVRTEAERLTEFTEGVTTLLQGHSVRILDVSSSRDVLAGEAHVTLFLSMRAGFLAPTIVDEVAAIEGVRHANWSVLE